VARFGRAFPIVPWIRHLLFAAPPPVPAYIALDHIALVIPRDRRAQVAFRDKRATIHFRDKRATGS
jgi:hypothetical protein